MVVEDPPRVTCTLAVNKHISYSLLTMSLWCSTIQNSLQYSILLCPTFWVNFSVSLRVTWGGNVNHVTLFRAKKYWSFTFNQPPMSVLGKFLVMRSLITWPRLSRASVKHVTSLVNRPLVFAHKSMMSGLGKFLVTWSLIM